MTTSGQTICLCMIVKDEAPVIARCLASVRPIVDHWIIVDTGSSDGTQDIVRKAMADVPGELVERPWVDFGHNRSEALALARPHAAYSLIIDADDFFETPENFDRPFLSADSYVVDIKDGATAYQRTQLVRNVLAWRYTGVLHEYVNCPEASSVGHFPLVMRRNHDGARRRNPETYRRDAAILERALETETDPFLAARYTFYLAQSWRDCGERERSIAAYLRRAELGFWNEEIFVSLLQAARLKEALGHSVDDTLATYARATAMVPIRAEALHDGSKLCRAKDRFEEGYWLAKRGAALPLPASGLFLEPWIYEYGLLDELGVHAYWSGRYEESRAACDTLLSERTSPHEVRDRVAANRRFAVDKLGAEAAEPEPSPTAAANRETVPEPDLRIAALLSLDQPAISIVDVGAAALGEGQFYQPLLDQALGRLTSFEPDPASYDELVRTSEGRDKILCLALGDGASHTLHLAPGGMTSVLEADQASYDLFDLFAKPPFSTVDASSSRQTTIATTRLDDVADLDAIDFFKLDVQGAELMILQNGREKLRACSVVQVEVPFVTLYKDQPAFGDIDAELRAQGFMVHGFATIKRLPLHPYDAAGPLSGINQLIDLDMIYVRDMRVMEDLPAHVLQTTAAIADMCFGSFDLALRCLTEAARRGLVEPGAPERYARAAAGRKRVGYIHYTPIVQSSGGPNA